MFNSLDGLGELAGRRGRRRFRRHRKPKPRRDLTAVYAKLRELIVAKKYNEDVIQGQKSSILAIDRNLEQFRFELANTTNLEDIKYLEDKITEYLDYRLRRVNTINTFTARLQKVLVEIYNLQKIIKG